ncbi:MAG: hypothetical protein AAF518_14460 [Spirochaetota bacterium]
MATTKKKKPTKKKAVTKKKVAKKKAPPKKKPSKKKTGTSSKGTSTTTPPRKKATYPKRMPPMPKSGKLEDWKKWRAAALRYINGTLAEKLKKAKDQKEIDKIKKEVEREKQKITGKKLLSTDNLPWA